MAENLYIVDPTGGELWEITDVDVPGNATSKGAFPFALFNPSGITSHGGNLYIVTPAGDELWEITDVDVPGSATLKGTFPAALAQPLGITSHGGNLYVADNQSDNLWEITDVDAPGSATNKGSLPTGLSSPQGITSHGGNLYVVDVVGDNLWEITDVDAPGSATNKGSLPTGLSSPQGITSHGGNLYVVDPAGDELWEITDVDAPGNATLKGTFPAALTNPLGLTSHDPNPSQPPTANAGTDQTVIGGATVTLNSGGSTDIDGSIISQGWTQTAGTTVTLSDPSAVAPTFTAPTTATEREYTFQVEVTDDGGLTATDTVTITVEANQAPVVSIQTGDMTVNAGAVVSLAATIADREGGTLTPSWVADPANGTFTDSGAVSTMWTAPDDLTANTLHRLTLTGEDALGLTHMDTVEITVRRANMAPIVDAGDHQDVEPGATVTLTAIASDQDGTIASYLWAQISGTVITLMAANTSEATFTAPADFDTHSLSFRCSVTDNDGDCCP